MTQLADRETVTAWGGLPLVVETMRALDVDEAARRHLPQPQRRGGFGPDEKLESLVTMLAAGGDRLEDVRTLAEDKGLMCLLDTPMPSPDALLDFLHQFHDESSLAERPEDKRAFVPNESVALKGLDAVNRALVARAVAPDVLVATIDLDGTIIESHNRNATRAYEGTKGYQPLIAFWAEQQLVVADEFRDGNVAGGQDPLSCAKRAFDALPKTVMTRYFRGDSACYHKDLLRYLVEQSIGFSISADMTKELRVKCLSVAATGWSLVEQRFSETVEWAEVEFVPGTVVHKEWKPLRYIALRISPRQGSLFEEDVGPKFLAVVSNRHDLSGPELIDWHWQKAGTVEHAHRVLKDELGAGVMPSAVFGANAAWFRINAITFNVLSALRRRFLPGRYSEARPKRLRFEVLNLPAKLSRHQGRLTLGVSASEVRLRELIETRTRLRTLCTHASVQVH